MLLLIFTQMYNINIVFDQVPKYFETTRRPTMKFNKKGFVLFSSLTLALMFILSKIPAFAATTDTWTTKAPMSTARAYHQVAVVDDKIYAIGGYNSSGYLNSVEEYDPATNKWITKASMLTARAENQVALVDGKIYATGGYTTTGSPLKSVEEYDPVTNTWTTKAPMTTARYFHQVAVVGGKIYAIGGYNRNTGSVLNSVEEYDPATNTWTTKAPMTNVRYSHQVAVVGGKIYAIGGYNNNIGSIINSVEEYDPATNKWITKAPMTTARQKYQLTVIGGKIYAIGGCGDDGNTYLNSVEEYDPATDKWTVKAAMRAAKHSHEVAVVGDKIYAIGGFISGSANNSVEEYDPETNTWTSKLSMTTARGYHQAAVVGNKIYAMGGCNVTGFIKSVEEYDIGYIVPESPTNLTAAAGNAKVDLLWTATEGATGYNIKRSITAGGPYTTIKNNASKTMYTDANVTNGTTYYYVVSAVNPAGESGNSNEVSAKPISPAEAPTALIARTSDFKVDLSWTASEGATGYNIKRSTTAGGPYATIKNNASGTTYTDANVIYGTTYYYVVSAVNQVGESGNSNEVSATTLPDALGIIKINFQPAGSETPQGYIPDYGEVYGVRNGYNYGWNVGYAGATRDRNINFDQKLDTLIMMFKSGRWEMAVDNGLYDVTVCVGDAGFTSTPTVNVEGVNYWAGINLGVNQYLQATKTVMVNDGRLTIDNGGTADQITKLNYVEIAKHIIQLQKPINLQASVAQGTVILTWDKSYENEMEGATGYNIKRSITAGGPYTTIATCSAITYSDNTVTNGTTYYYVVSAVNQAVESENSNEVSATPTSSAVITPTATVGNATTTTVDLTVTDSNPWTTQYQIVSGTQYVTAAGTLTTKPSWITLTSKTVTVTGLVPNTAYSFQAKARDSASIETSLSEVASVTTLAQAPTAAVSNATLTTVDVTATDSNPTRTEYQIISGSQYVKSDGTLTTTVTWITLTGKKVTVTGLIPNTAYRFQVKARNSANIETALSAAANGTTLAPTAIEPPSDISVTTTDTVITVSWSSVTGATGYDIELDNKITENVTSPYIYRNLAPGSQHTYRVRSLNYGIKGEWSEPVTVTTARTFTWPVKASMSTARAYHQVAVIDGKIYAIGGYNCSSALNSVEEYDPTTDTWITKESMLTARDSFQVAVVGGKIYAIGGHNGKNALNSVEEYDPATNTWTTKASMTYARSYPHVAQLNGKIYVIGGLNSNNILNSVEEYDPATNTWTTKASMLIARYHHQVAVVGDKIYAIGGYAGINGYNLSSVEEYDPATNTWMSKSPMTNGRNFHQVAVVGGKIYAIGGVSSRYLNSVEEYDPVTNKWTTKASMSTARAYHQVAVLGDKIYVIGGSSDGGVLNSVEEYDPATNARTSIASMNTGRLNHQVAVVGDKIYVIGGETGIAYFNSVEEYDTSYNVPESPTNLTATARDAKVDLSWTKVNGEADYIIKRSTTAGGPYTKIKNYVSGTTYTDAVTNGTTYYYVVSAVNQAGESGNSNEITATPTSPAVTTPAATVGNATTTTVDVTVTDSNPGTTQYQIVSGNQYVTAAGTLTTTATWVTLTSKKITITGLVPNTAYSFQAKARDSANIETALSAVASGTTLAQASTAAVSNATATTVDVTATDSNPAATEYQIISGSQYVKSDGTLTTTATWITLTGKKVTVSGLIPNTAYSFQVKARNSANIETALSAAASGTTLAQAPTATEAPRDINVTATDTVITVSWSSVIGATGYDIEADNIITENVTSPYTYRNLAPGSQHTYRIRSLNYGINYGIKGEWSQPVIVTTLSELPGTIKINFQPADSEIPQGYIPDYGEVYGGRNGYSYGWNVGYAGATRDRNINADQKLDTLIMLYKTGKWEMEVEDGFYDVTVCAGDAGFTSTPTVTVEGVNYWAGINLGVNQYLQATKTVMVTDGRLTIDNGGTADQITKLNYVEISNHSIQLQKPINLKASATQDNVTLTWDKSYEMDLYEVEADGNLYAVTGEVFTHTFLEGGTTHSYRVRMVNGTEKSEWSDMLTISTQPEAPGTIKINFQPAGSEIPQGYIPDYGEVYGVRNGYNYGWNVGYAGATRDRNINADQKLDTLIMLYKTGKWEMEVEDGSYDVTVCVGDAGFNSTPTVNVEGVNYLEGINLGANQYLQATKTVMVTDGRLTIDNGETADQITKIDYVKIVKRKRF